MRKIADGKVTISTALDNKGFEKGLGSVSGKLGGLTKVVTATAAAITAAFATAAVAISKQAVEAYADWEQLSGGVETLFKNSADKVKKYAEDAFYTAGISANEYMETVTGVSASLISSLGGDTEKAADIANMAIIDMADNANKMGTPLENVKTAYAGFAKQQYMLLDNLKLGYGGTKTEMERLLKDAQAYSGVKYDINNLGDVYNAIHAIQEKLGIAGATAEEAEKTITGSANMTKAAWKNVLAAIAGGGDLDKAINNLVYSISKYFDNIVPVVQRSLVGIGQLIERIAPQLVQTVASALIKALPSLLNAVYQMIIGLAKGIYQGIVALFTGGSITNEVSAQLNGVAESAGSAADAEQDLANGISEAGKAAKKTTAGFDELNVLQSDTGSGNADSNTSIGGGFSGTGVTFDTGGVNGVLNDTMSKFDEFIAKIKSALEILKAVFAPTISAFADFGTKIGAAVNNALPNFNAGLENFRLGFSNLLTYMGEEFIPNFVNSWSENILPIFGDVTAFGITELGNNFAWLGTLFNDVINNVIVPALTTMQTISTDVMTGIKDAWDKTGGELLANLSTAFEGIRQTIDTFYQEFLKPVIDTVLAWINEMWEQHLKPLWDVLVDAFLDISNNILILWNKVLKPVIDWILQKIYPPIKNVIDRILDIVGTIIGYVSGVIQGVIKVVKGIIAFITGVFTGDWEKAWNGVKDIIGGIWDMIWAGIKGTINLIIDGINTLWSGIYNAVKGIVDTIGDVAGVVGDLLGQNWKFSMPAKPPLIPKLAQGAVLPPNKPFLAMVGDQHHGTNVEAPLSTIQEAVALVMSDQTQAILAGFEASVGVQREILEAVLGISIGDDVIGNAVARYNRKQAVVRGGAL